MSRARSTSHAPEGSLYRVEDRLKRSICLTAVLIRSCRKPRDPACHSVACVSGGVVALLCRTFEHSGLSVRTFK